MYKHLETTEYYHRQLGRAFSISRLDRRKYRIETGQNLPSPSPIFLIKNLTNNNLALRLVSIDNKISMGKIPIGIAESLIIEADFVITKILIYKP